MMTIKDYAQDVELEIEEIEALCDKIGIEYQDENTDLDETSIILLDNAVAEKDNEEEANEDEEIEEERRLEEEVEDKAEELAFNTKIDLDDTTSFTKVKPKQVKKNDNNKKDFLKERKKIYKHREKLQEKAMALATKVYEQAAKDRQQEENEDEKEDDKKETKKSKKKDDDVKEADIEEE